MDVRQIIFLKEKNLLLIVLKDKIKLCRISENVDKCLLTIENYNDDDFVHLFKINDELFLNHFYLLKIEYDSKGKPIKMGFINKFLNEKVGQIFKEFLPKYFPRNSIIPHSQNFYDFENSCINIDSKTFLHLNCNNNMLYLISRNKNNDLIVKKKVELFLGTCYWNIVAVDKIKNHLILGKNYYKDYGWYQYMDDGEYYNYLENLLFYDLNNFSKINHIILKNRKVINNAFNNNYCDIIGLFNSNLKKNIFYCSFPPIKIYLISLKNYRIRTFHNTVDFKENEITEKNRPQKVFFLDYSQLIIV